MSSITYTPINEAYINRELKRLFGSLKRGHGNHNLIKYKSRFMAQMNRTEPVETFVGANKDLKVLSLGKKLEILCTYGNHKLIKRK